MKWLSGENGGTFKTGINDSWECPISQRPPAKDSGVCLWKGICRKAEEPEKGIDWRGKYFTASSPKPLSFFFFAGNCGKGEVMKYYVVVDGVVYFAKTAKEARATELAVKNAK